MRTIAERALTQAELNRALLARQDLLERRRLPLPRMLEDMGALQAQYAPSMYVGLFSRVAGFQRAQLDRALARRTVIQATLMRATIHLVSRADYWPLALAVRGRRRTDYLRAYPEPGEAAMAAAGERLRAALADGPLWRREVEALIGKDCARGINLWLELVRVPPSGTWERRRADLWGLAEEWVGPPAVALGGQSPECHLVRRYLRGYGPATRQDVQSFTGLSLSEIDAALAGMVTRRFADGLVDLPRAPLPHPETPAPPRLIGHWDAILLAHARRTGVLPEKYRSRIFHVRRPASASVFLIDGAVAGEWTLDGAITPFGTLAAADRRAVAEEIDALRASVDEV